MSFWGRKDVSGEPSRTPLTSIPFFGGVMAPRRQDVDRLPIIPDQASVIPRPLLELYNRAFLFLDKKSAVYDHYWAVGIHKAIHASFPECGETHTARTKKQKPTIGSSCQVSPQIARTLGKREQRSTIKQRASKEKRRRKIGPPTS
jgi:hypothetical protein